MKYKYTTYLPDDRGKFIKRPMVEIDIFGPKGNLKQLALLDSGADRSVFNLEIAKYLGVDLSKNKISEITGITGKTKVFVVYDVEIKVEYLGAIKIPVGFIDSPYVGALLGQEGFFDANKIKFEKDHNTFEINTVKK